MTYEASEQSVAGGQPFYLYRFTQGLSEWRFTSRASDWLTVDEEEEPVIWEASSISHGAVTDSSDMERAKLELALPLSDGFARRFLQPPGNVPTHVTIFRGHEAVPDETRAHWKGKILGADIEGARILLNCESVISTLRRAGVRAKYQRLCRHVLYGSGCRLNIEEHFVAATATALSGLVVTVPEAAEQPDGWYRGGILRFDVHLGFILQHSGSSLRLSSGMPELDEAVLAALPEEPVAIQIAPGCDLRASTCEAKFDNLLNFGGFKEIPGRNPFGGGSIV